MTLEESDIQVLKSSHLDELIIFLEEIKSDFNMKIDRNVTIHSYAEKILSRAYCIAICRDSKLSGLVATYCNDMVHKHAYITMVGVAPVYRKKGIARLLLEYTISHLREINMRSVALVTANLKARELYKSIGFIEIRHEINSEGENLYHLEMRF